MKTTLVQSKEVASEGTSQSSRSEIPKSNSNRISRNRRRQVTIITQETNENLEEDEEELVQEINNRRRLNR